MNAKDNMVTIKLKTRILIGYLTITCIIIIVGVIAYLQLMTLENQVKYLTGIVAGEVKTTNEIRAQTLSMRTAVEKFIYLNKEIDKSEANQCFKRVDKLIQKAQKSKNGLNNNRLKEINQAVQSYNDKFKKIAIRLAARENNKKILADLEADIIKKLNSLIIIHKDNVDLFQLSINSLGLFVAASSDVQNFLISNDHSFSEKAVDSFEKIIDSLSTIDSQDFENIKYDIEDYMDDFEGLVAVMIKMKDEIDRSILPLAPKIVEYSIDVANSGWYQMEFSKNEINYQVSLTKNIILIIAGLSVFIGLAMGMFHSELILKPIIRVVDFAKQVSEGDLSETLPVMHTDEIGRLLKAINTMIHSFRKVVIEVKSNAEHLSKSSDAMVTIAGQLENNSDDMSNQAGNVADASRKMSENINSIAQTVAQISDKVREVSQTAEQMSNNMNTVALSIGEMSKSMNDIEKHTQIGSKITGNAVLMSRKAGDTMSSLGKAANEIGGVTEVIKRIAYKTNLLALNASIEAASAGDAGKGFSVVARAIQNFADQSGQAAEDIARRITGVQKSTSEAVDAIKDITNIVEDIHQSSDTILHSVKEQTQTADQIVNHAKQADHRAKDIAKSMMELAEGSKDLKQNVMAAASGAIHVTENIHGVSIATIDSTSNIKKVNMSAVELDRLSRDLKDLVGVFIVESEENSNILISHTKWSLIWQKIKVRMNSIYAIGPFIGKIILKHINSKSEKTILPHQSLFRPMNKIA